MSGVKYSGYRRGSGSMGDPEAFGRTRRPRVEMPEELRGTELRPFWSCLLTFLVFMTLILPCFRFIAACSISL